MIYNYHQNHSLTLDLVALSQATPDLHPSSALLICKTDCILQIDQHNFHLKKQDIVLLRYKQPINLMPIDQQAFYVSLFFVPIACGIECGPNELVTSMTCSQTDAHIVFRRFNYQICVNYLNQIKALTTIQPQDNFLKYQESTLMSLLLTELSRYGIDAIAMIESNFLEYDLKKSSRSIQFGIILNYIVANLATVNLTKAALHFEYDPNYFSRLTRQLFHKTFTEEVRFIRMSEAQKLLEITNRSVADIALTLGYQSPSTFNRYFKQRAGQTPSAYRKLYQT